MKRARLPIISAIWMINKGRKRLFELSEKKMKKAKKTNFKNFEKSVDILGYTRYNTICLEANERNKQDKAKL